MSLPIVIESYNLQESERRICTAALHAGDGITEGARLLGISRHALKRRIVKLNIQWPRQSEESA